MVIGAEAWRIRLLKGGLISGVIMTDTNEAGFEYAKRDIDPDKFDLYRGRENMVRFTVDIADLVEAGDGRELTRISPLTDNIVTAATSLTMLHVEAAHANADDRLLSETIAVAPDIPRYVPNLGLPAMEPMDEITGPARELGTFDVEIDERDLYFQRLGAQLAAFNAVSVLDQMQLCVHLARYLELRTEIGLLEGVPAKADTLALRRAEALAHLQAFALIPCFHADTAAEKRDPESRPVGSFAMGVMAFVVESENGFPEDEVVLSLFCLLQFLANMGTQYANWTTLMDTYDTADNEGRFTVNAAIWRREIRPDAAPDDEAEEVDYPFYRRFLTAFEKLARSIPDSAFEATRFHIPDTTLTTLHEAIETRGKDVGDYHEIPDAFAGMAYLGKIGPLIASVDSDDHWRSMPMLEHANAVAVYVREVMATILSTRLDRPAHRPEIFEPLAFFMCLFDDRVKLAGLVPVFEIGGGICAPVPKDKTSVLALRTPVDLPPGKGIREGSFLASSGIDD